MNKKITTEEAKRISEALQKLNSDYKNEDLQNLANSQPEQDLTDYSKDQSLSHGAVQPSNRPLQARLQLPGGLSPEQLTTVKLKKDSETPATAGMKVEPVEPQEEGKPEEPAPPLEPEPQPEQQQRAQPQQPTAGAYANPAIQMMEQAAQTNFKIAEQQAGIELAKLDAAQTFEQNRQIEQNILKEKQKVLYDEKQKIFNEAMELKVDPNRANVFHGKSTGNKILAGIAIMMGALGGSMSGSNRNYAFETIMNAIDQDIKLQQDEIKNKQISAKNGLEELRQKGLDESEALNLQYARTIKQTLDLLERQKIALDPQKQAALDLSDKAKLQQEEQRYLQAAQAAAMNKAQKDVYFTAKKDREENALVVEGLGYKGKARSVSEAIKYRKIIADVEQFNSDADAIINNIKTHGTDLGLEDPWNTDSKAKAQTLRGLLRSESFLNMGVPSGKDEESLDKIIPADPHKLFSQSKTVIEKLLAAKKYINGLSDSKLSKISKKQTNTGANPILK